MKRARTEIICIAVLFALSTSAVAQAQTDYFAQRPNGADYAHLYPEQALVRSVIGAVMLCCTPGVAGSIRCRVDREWPRGYGFGEASLGVATHFRLSGKGQKELEKRRDGGLMRIPIMWSMTSQHPLLVEQRRLIRESWRRESTCGDLLIS